MMSSMPSEKAVGLVGRLRVAFGLREDGTEKEDDGGASLRYVIYLRKSTNDEKDKDDGKKKKQERSISDQLIECKALAERLGLRVVTTIHEEKSAKVSDQREKFLAMLQDLRTGKYEGVITWAPDRLARNMKEGGEIIDMLDHGVIHDIKFANNFVFTNDSSGKMLLGITFIMAKQFSDSHSAAVSRGIKLKTLDGKWAGSGKKHGYYKDKLHHLRPDGENHKLVSEAFKMRINGKSLKEIVEFLSDRGFPVKTTHTKRRTVSISVKFVSDLLRDPIYAGAMIFGDHVVNLFEKYDFIPAVSPEDFEEINKLEGVKKGYYKLTDIIKPSGSIKADLMRDMVICGDCNRPMSTGMTPKRNKQNVVIRHYFYFRCDTPGCMHKGKSIRAKVVMSAIYGFLDAHPLKTPEGYKHYVAEMERILAEKQKEAERELRSIRAQRHGMDQRLADLKNLLGKEDDVVLAREHKKDIKIQLQKIQSLEARTQKLGEQKAEAKDVILSSAEFIELFQNIANLIQNIDSMADLDFIVRKFFSNLTIKDGKVAEITQNSPFRELCLDADSAMVTLPGIEPGFAP